MAQDLLARMAARAGVSVSDARAHAAIGAWTGMRKMMKPIEDTEELHRVVSLPRRDWQAFEDWLIQEMTAWLKLPGGQQTLRLLQASALAELHDVGGLLAPIRVGGGKTLITFLAPVVLNAARPLLLVPGGLLSKTERDFQDYALHWKMHQDYTLRSYDWLSRINAAGFLERYQPDFICADEAHKIGNRDAACTRRLERFMEDPANRHVKFMALSGTMTKHSIMDFHHLLRWSLGERMMPMPKTRTEAGIWALALDPKVSAERRPLPGALVRLLPDQVENPGEEEVRVAFGKRVYSTPGIISTTTAGIDAPIYLELWDPELPDEIIAPIQHLYKHEETPNGELLQSQLDVWRHAREMIMGFYYRWDPPAPKHWLLARKTWSAFVRDTISLDTKVQWNGQTLVLDTEQQVAWAIQNGLLQDFGVLRKWLEVKDTFVPNKVPEWLTHEMIHKVRKEVESTGPQLVWVANEAIGEELSRQTGWSFFAEGGLDARGRYVEDCPGEVAILSMKANIEGRNLQYGWNRNLILNCPSSAHIMEQLLGRSHREGQEANEVHAKVLIGHSLLENAFASVCAGARFLQEVQQQPQKILQADRIAS